MTIRRLFLALLGATMLTRALQAQLRLETLVLKNGKTVTGEILEVTDDAFVIGRKVRKAAIKQTLKFDQLSPNSMYAALVSVLAPLDTAEHLRIADLTFKAKLFPIARRHWLATVAEGSEPTAAVAERIAVCETKDIEHLLERSRGALKMEQFSRARRLAMTAMRRYSSHAAVKTIPNYLGEITKAYEDARRRNAALARSKKAKREWERGERYLAEVESWIKKALKAEARGLQATEQFRLARSRLDAAAKYLRSAEKQAAGLRQSPKLPRGLWDKLAALEEDIIALHIRTRLHVASLYTVRGSYGTALAYVNSALSYDPSNEQALKARARIEEAAAVSSVRPFRGLR